MRVITSMYYKNIYGSNNQKLTHELFDVNKQIASGLKIQYASDDIRTFTETMRLDNEVTTLGQIKKSTESGYKVANQTDVVLSDFEKTLSRMKTLLISASNGTNDRDSTDAIAKELRGLESHLKNLSNSSIDGKYLFSGSATNIKPISEDGHYRGNDKVLNAFVGSNNYQQANLSGAELFLGEESSKQKKISTNVVNIDEVASNKQIGGTGTRTTISENSTIRELVGDIDSDDSNDPTSHFYVRGKRSNGEAFSQRIDLESNQKVSDLLKSIEDIYGTNKVQVSLNNNGEIEVQDKLRGSSQLDFFMVGATDFNVDGNNNDDAIVNNLFDLESKKVHVKSFVDSKYSVYDNPNTTSIVSLKDSNLFTVTGVLYKDSLQEVADEYTPLNDVLYPLAKQIKMTGSDVDGNAVDFTFDTSGKNVHDLLVAIDDKFDNSDNHLRVYFENGKIKIKSDDDTASSNFDLNMQTQKSNGDAVAGFGMDTSLVYDTTSFHRQGDTLTSSVSQIIKKDNAFATEATKLSEVADLSIGNANTLDGTQYRMQGQNIEGQLYETTIDLKNSANGGSKFRVKIDTDNDGIYDSDNTYTIFNMENPRTATDADELSYRQFMDVMNMVLANELPASDTADEYDKAIQNADEKSNVTFSYDGKLTFSETKATLTKASILLYDTNNGAHTLTFQANNAVTIEDSKNDFFKMIDKAIVSVENYKLYPDNRSGNPRDIGMENAIQTIEDLSNHVSRMHAQIGSQANSLTKSLERTSLLEINTLTLRSSVVDTDLAEASMRLAQLNTNYQAMLSTVGKISQLSLVNYL